MYLQELLEVGFSAFKCHLAVLLSVGEGGFGNPDVLKV
jgi:hypothetical protein